jgi:eukaryotic-like serine/threonine-protein kinase
VQTGAHELLSRSKLAAMERSQLQSGFGVDPSDWTGDSILFSASSGSAGLSGSLWRVNITPRFHVQRPVERLTSDTENELQPSAVGHRIAFATLTQNENIWSLSVNPNTGMVSGEPLRLTSSAAADILPAPSADGKRVAFASNRNGNMHVWIKDLAANAETMVTSTPDNELPWLLSPDGSRLVYCIVDTSAGGDRGCFVGSTSGGAARNFCKDCPSASIQDWFENGRKVLYKKGLTNKSQFILRDIDSGQETLFLEHPRYSVSAARFSRDDRWVSFQIVIEPATRRQIFIAPVHNGVAAGESEWIPITDGFGLDRNAVWSPDGNLLYFLSERDGFRCFWAQRLDPATKRAAGPAFAVHHFHQAGRSLMQAEEVVRIGFSVTSDKIIFSLPETRGNIWLADFE